jgi:Hg(II)-responsive transcriptional regulator
MSESLRSGAVAELAGVNIETLRYYERRKLLACPPRTESGYRLYTSEAVRQVRFIKKAQLLGFTLEEIRDLIGLSHAAPAPCREVRDLVDRKIAFIDEKIRQLQSMQKALRTLSAGCPGSGKKIDCPILDSLEGIKEPEQ